MKVSLLHYTSDPIFAIASAAMATRNVPCSEMYTKSRKELESTVKYCYECGHWAMLEFADFDFEIQGVSRILETQLVRNRMSSYAISSGRQDREYTPCDYAVDHDEECNLTAIEGGIMYFEDCIRNLDTSEESGLHSHAIGNARYALPQGIAQLIRVKKNLRNLIDTSHIRLCAHAQDEYRELMMEIKTLVTLVHPLLGSFLVPRCTYSLYCTESPGCGMMPSKKEVSKILGEVL